MGTIVDALAPYSEADPAALLLQGLMAFGNLIGRRAHFMVEADRHGMNLFLCLMGTTAKSRKGTSWGHIRRLFATVDAAWADDRIQQGLASGPGMIWHVRDAIV
jgi:hypothetical protein